MIIFDFNQVAISNLMEQIGSSKQSVDEALVRHMILNTIRTYVKKFKSTHGPDVILACDSKNYWRKEIFPYYKANRKKARDSSGHDWSSIFECLNKIRSELKEFSPYKVIEVDTCEADDIISILVQKYSATEKVMILSSDKDFAQLQKFPNVTQYSPIMKKYIKEENPNVFLKEHIIRGDKGDGVPNILSSDDVFVNGGRQKSIRETSLSEWINQSVEDFAKGEILRNWSRNEALIDLTKIPDMLKTKIINNYEESVPKSRQIFMNYMIEKRLKNLIEVFDEF